MHACCLDTYPPISYMTDTSRDIQKLVHYLNDVYNKTIVSFIQSVQNLKSLLLISQNVINVRLQGLFFII